MYFRDIEKVKGRRYLPRYLRQVSMMPSNYMQARDLPHCQEDDRGC